MTLTAAETGARCRILVVEDEALIAEEIRDRLTRLKFDVVGVEDTGERAMSAAWTLRPDLVLMDIRLKGRLDGIETAHEICARLDVPVIYLTAHADQATLQRAKHTAPLGYVLKPFQERELEVAIEMALYRHGLERRLRASERRYAATLSGIGDGVIATDLDGRITFMNPVAEALTGWRLVEADRLPANRIFVIVDESTGGPIPDPIADVLRQSLTVHLTRPMLLSRRDGANVPIDDSIAPIVDDDGTLIGAVVAFRDLRPRRQADDRLRQAEAQLRQSQKLESIGRLAGGVAHDVNNLLTVVKGCCELLRRSPDLTESDAIRVRNIDQACERTTGLIRQLLAFGRRQPLQLVDLDVNQRLTESRRLIQQMTGPDVEVTLTLDPVPAVVRADPSQIDQIIMNLVVNARDAMPSGGSLKLGTSHFQLDELGAMAANVPSGPYVRLSVSDSGVGMDDIVKSHLFEPFYTTKEPGRGTGLGLSMVYGAVQQSGGFIDVISDRGVGTTFHISLPASNASPSATSPTASESAPRHGNETILLVDDEEAVRDAMADGLETYGYIVTRAASGEEALQLLAAAPDRFHMLVTDALMPGMSGYAVAHGALKLRPDLPLLLISGHTEYQEFGKAAPSGASLLAKPFTPATLALRVREMLDARRANR